jgi:hypothetical protein
VKPRVLIVLALLVAGLYVWQQDEEQRALEPTQHAYDYALLDGLLAGPVDASLIESFRIDNLRREVQVGLARRPDFGFDLVDPIVWPAEPAQAGALVDFLLRARGQPIVELDLQSYQLDPPRAVLEVTRRDDEGATTDPRLRTWRVELGAVDLDPRKVVVRAIPPPGTDGVPARVLRIPRNLETALWRDVDEWRDHRLLPFDGSGLLSLRRAGSLPGRAGEEPRDLTLDVLLEPEGWRSLTSPRASLDPRSAALLTQFVATLRARRFHEDAPGPLPEYGLDPATFTIRLGHETDGEHTLRFAPDPADAERPPQERSWLVVREGLPTIFELDHGDVELLVRPVQDFFDHRVFRAVRQDVQAVELAMDGEVVRVERRGEDWVLVRAGGEVPADAGSVEDVLAQLEHAELPGYPPGLPLGDVEGHVAIEGPGGIRWGGEIGSERFDLASGSPERSYRRFGDDVVGLLPPGLDELARTPAKELVSLVVWKLAEVDVDRLRVTGGTAKRTFARSGASWVDEAAPDQPLAASDPFFPMLESLLSLKAVRRLEPDEIRPIGNPGPVNYIVRFESGGEPVEVAIIDPNAAGEWELRGPRGAILAPELLAAIDAVLGR